MLAWWACVAAPAGARQTGETAGGAGNESDPIACWWRTDRAAVHVGERFTLTLTCGLLDTSDLRVVADRERLDPAALDLTPFEVVGGTRHDDIQAPPRRYFQYSYTLRLFGEDRFGRDVDIPSVPITYNIQTSGVSATRGRDQLYLLPALPVRMLSLVPLTATDIQDASPDTFGDIDRRAVRATGELAAAGLFFTFAVALAGLALVRVARPRLARGALEPGLLAPVEILRGCVRDAERVRSEAGLTGWTTELVGHALTLLRLAAAVALGRTVAQRVSQGRVAADDGQLAVRKGALTAKRVLVSAATTPGTIDAALSRPIDPRVRSALEEIREAMRVFTASRYSRVGSLDRAALDTSLDSALAALRRLHEMHQWRSRTVDALSRATDRVKAVWDR